jgi:hypothetical protein
LPDIFWPEPRDRWRNVGKSGRCELILKAVEVGKRGIAEGCSDDDLLDTQILHVGVDERVEDGEDVAAVLDDASENVAQLGLALGFAVPFGENGRRNFDVAAKALRRMTTQKKAIEEGCFALREVEIVDDLGGNELWHRGHGEEAVYPKAVPRQVVRQIPCRVGGNSPHGRMPEGPKSGGNTAVVRWFKQP